MNMNKLTPYMELDSVLRLHANELHRVLGDMLVGYYLQGSLAIGDFDLTSDVDFVVVTKDELSNAKVNDVQAVHNAMYVQDNRWVKRLEYSFFPVSLMQQPSSPYPKGDSSQEASRELWYFDNGHKDIERSDHCNTLVTRWTVRENGITVLGPDPATFLPRISPNHLRNEIKNTLMSWGRELLSDPSPYNNRFYQSYLVLNFSRMLHDLQEGKIDSKLSGIKWAKENLDSKWIPLIDYCWEERKDTEISVTQPAVAEKYEEALAYVRYIVELGKIYKVEE